MTKGSGDSTAIASGYVRGWLVPIFWVPIAATPALIGGSLLSWIEECKR